MTRYIARYLAGRVRSIPGFRSFRTSKLRVQTVRTHLHVGIDGELFSLDAPLTVSIAPQSLSVRVPRPVSRTEG
jgi:diacylglycerol kinase family enzyme